MSGANQRRKLKATPIYGKDDVQYTGVNEAYKKTEKINTITKYNPIALKFVLESSKIKPKINKKTKTYPHNPNNGPSFLVNIT
jgi:hypothetical protein